MITLTTDILTGAAKIAIGITTQWAKNKGSNYLGLDKTGFTKELEKVIEATLNEYNSIFPIPDEGIKFAFYKSEVLIQTLLTIKLIGQQQADVAELKKLFEQNVNIIQPKESDVIRFLQLFEENCKKNPTLIQHQFNDNYKEAIFATLEIVASLQSTVHKVLSEIKTSLTEEYFSQLDEIQKNINCFKPRTALERIDGLEKRISQGNRMTKEVESKLFFLKGKCFLNVGEHQKGSEFIVKAYLLLNNGALKEDAAIAYLNLQEDQKATELAEEIVRLDPFSGTAWLILVIQSKGNYKTLWNDIPVSVKTKRGFVVGVMHYFHHSYTIYPNVDHDLGLRLPEETHEKISSANIQMWEQIAAIKLNLYFSSVKQFFIDSKGKLANSHIDGLTELVDLLKRIFDTIKGTEVYENYPLLRFYYSFCRHLLRDDNFDKEEIKTDYARLNARIYSVDIHYAEYLADSGFLQDALDILNQSKFKSDETIFLHRIIYTKTAKKEIEALNLLKEHIATMSEIDFLSIFNLNNLFYLFLPNRLALKEEFTKILKSRSFTDENIKELFTLTIQINYFNDELDNEEVKRSLTNKSVVFSDKKEILFYISQLLYRLKAFTECVQILAPMTEMGKQTEANLLYCEARFRGNIGLQPLMKFLEKIRNDNENNGYPFLAIEHDLRKGIEDFDSITDIAWRSVKQYPEVEYFHLALLNALERKGLTEEIRQYVLKYLPPDFKYERIGLNVSIILRRNGFRNEGAQLLYVLASKPTNSEARTNYAFPDFPDGFFISYSEIENGSHVKLIDKNKRIKLLTAKMGDSPSLVGKKVGDTVMLPGKSGMALREFQVAAVMNAPLFLFAQILAEASDPNSELGLEMYDFSKANGEFDVDAFKEQIIDKLVSDSTVIREVREEKLCSYNKGESSFSEICRSNFSDNPLDCYNYLTSTTFFAIPAFHNSQIELSNEETFALDFTSLMFLSDIEASLGINSIQRYVVSPNLVTVIRNKIIELESSPFPERRLVVWGNQLVPVNYPEDYFVSQLSKYKQLLSFINNHCDEKVMEEKIEFFSFLSKLEKNEPFFDCIVDNTMFCTNLGYTLITNDSFIVRHFGQLNPKIISPENYLMRCFKGSLPKEVVEHFVAKHYVGVVLNTEVLINEYRKKQRDVPNSFNTCLSGLKFRWSLSPINLMCAIKFLKDIYVSNLALDREKFLLSQSVFYNLLDGCSQNEMLISLIRSFLQVEFALLGESRDKIVEAFDAALNIYRS